MFFRVQYNQPQNGMCIFETNKGAKPTVGPGRSFLPSFGLEIGATQLLSQPNGQHFFTPGHVSSVTHLLKQDCFRTTLGQSPFLPVVKQETATKKEIMVPSDTHRHSRWENQRKEAPTSFRTLRPGAKERQ